MCAQRRLRSAWASAQSAWRNMPRLIWIFAGRTDHFVAFVMWRLIYYVFPKLLGLWYLPWVSCSSSEVWPGCICDRGGVAGDWWGRGEINTPAHFARKSWQKLRTYLHSLSPSFFNDTATLKGQKYFLYRYLILTQIDQTEFFTTLGNIHEIWSFLPLPVCLFLCLLRRWWMWEGNISTVS